jgi:hypothetical protein
VLGEQSEGEGQREEADVGERADSGGDAARIVDGMASVSRRETWMLAATMRSVRTT